MFGGKVANLESRISDHCTTWAVCCSEHPASTLNPQMTLAKLDYSLKHFHDPARGPDKF